MNIEEANNLVNKCMSVILSCKTMPQLNVACTYAILVYRQLARELGLINNTNFVSLIERTIGYAQCQIKSR